jgi:hypothetical protein
VCTARQMPEAEIVSVVGIEKRPRRITTKLTASSVVRRSRFWKDPTQVGVFPCFYADL